MKKIKQSLITFFGVFMLLVSGIADIGAIMTFANGLRGLIALFILTVLTVAYLIAEQALHAWHNYKTFRAKLADIRHLIQHRGRHDIIRQATEALKIYQQAQPLIRITHIQSPNVVIAELNPHSFHHHHCNDLLGMTFTISSLNGGRQSEGTITLCNQTHAHLQLRQPSTSIQVGDIATPIKPPQATELECLCAELLLIIDRPMVSSAVLPPSTPHQTTKREFF